MKLTRRYIQLRTTLDSFWKNYVNAFLSQLHARYKWKFPRVNISVNDIVAIRKESTPSGKWPLGRGTEIFPGKDELVRSVRLQTSTGDFERAVMELMKLSVEAGGC